jgi:hypothetical protein
VFKCKSGSELFLISDISLVSIVSGSMLLSTLTEVPSLMRVWSEPDLHLNTHDLDTVPKEVSNIKLTVNEATKHTVPECVEETMKRLVQPLGTSCALNKSSILFESFLIHRLSL